jgi:uncharacterized phage protein (TIGR02216 family)
VSARWDEALRQAVRTFGILPEAFWKLSVREWAALNGGGVRALGAGELAALMVAFPDGAEPR